MKSKDESEKNGITWPIGLKIFSIAACLLFLMASVTYITTRNLEKLNNHLNLLTNYFLPLDKYVGDVQLTQMSQRLIFDRLIKNGVPKSFEAAQKDAEAIIKDVGGCSRDQITQASRNTREKFKTDAERELVRYEIYRICGDRNLTQAQELISKALPLNYIANDPAYSRKATQIDEKLKYFRQVRNNLHLSVVKLFTNFKGSETNVSEQFISQVNDNRRLVNQSIREITELLHKSTQEMADESTKMERKAFRFSWAVTIIAAIVGLFYAALLTRSLVKPVRLLVGGVKAIQNGNLNAHLQVTSQDEIGVLTMSFNHMANELKEKEVIKETFGKYVDPRIVKEILERASVSTEGEKQIMTVQFSDIEGFTKICEHLSPEGTVRMLNQYFSMMSHSILEHKGIVDKYIGDAVMGFWGPPFCNAAEHSGLACLSALDQIERLESFNQMLPEIIGVRKGLPRINIRIGLCSGEVTLGSIGSEKARSYTVIGDTVNKASRIEQASKQYGTRIIISESTFLLARDLIEARELDIFIPTGKEEPVRVYELLGRKDKIDERIMELRDTFEQGLQSYRAQEWLDAICHFENCLRVEPADTPSKLFLSRTRHFQEHPPGSDWKGLWSMTHK